MLLLLVVGPGLLVLRIPRPSGYDPAPIREVMGG
jgi:hypothetical protein